MARKIEVEIVGDTRKLKGALKDSETATKRWANRMDALGSGRRGGLGSASGLLKGGGIAIGAGIALDQVNQLANAASDLNEQQTKSQAVFGKSAKAIETWSDTTATSLGISKRAALEASGTFGNLFTTVGIAGQASADMSRRLVGLASDLASFNNADPSDVLDALRSGLIGEAEPMRRYGVLLSEVRVQQQAMADTGKTNAKALTNQEKAVARYEIILHDTGKAQGDFARTAGGLANQQRIAAAQTEDLHGQLGKKLLPIVKELTKKENELLEATLNLADGFGRVDKKTGGFLGSALKNVVKIGFIMGPLGPVFMGAKLINDTLGKTEEKLGDVNAAAAAWAATMGGISLNPNLVPSLDKAATKAAATVAPPAFGQPGFKTVKPQAVPVVTTAEQRNRWFDSDITRRLDMVQDVKTLQGQVSALAEIAGLIRKRLAITNDITRRLSLEDQLRSVNRQRSSLADQMIADAAEAKKAAKALAEQTAALKLAQQTAREFRALGLTATGEEPVPGAANLRKQLSQLSSRDDIGTLPKKLQEALSRVRKLLKKEDPTREIRDYIQGLFATIREELNKGDQAGPLTKTTQLSERILAGLGLSADDARILKARLSHFTSAGTALSGTGTGSAVNLTSYTVIDGKVIATTSAKHNRRTLSYNVKPRNGPNAGGYVGA